MEISRSTAHSKPILLALPVIALILKIWLITHSLYQHDRPIDSLGFGFGGYIHHLLEDGSYESCTPPLPFKPCDATQCTHATRMPGLPIAFVLIAKSIAPTIVTVAVTKAIVLSVVTWCFIFMLTRRRAIPLFAVFPIAFALLGPQVLKHASVIDYEEGIITELMFCYAVAIGLITESKIEHISPGRLFPALLAVSLAGLMYLAKTTMLVLLMGTLVFSMVAVERRRWPWLVLTLCLFAVPAGLWARFTLATTGRASISSSWNGENLFIGSNPESMALYPDVSLDRIFDSDRAVLTNGTVVRLGHWSSRQCFANEWAWNDYYARLAKNWITSHPIDAAEFAVHKAWMFFIDVGAVPRRVSASDLTPMYHGVEQIAGVGWMVIGRIAFFALLFLCLRDAWSGKPFQLWVPVLLLAYAAPYVAVFSYQRHVVPALVASAVLLAIRFSRSRPFSAGQGASAA